MEQADQSVEKETFPDPAIFLDRLMALVAKKRVDNTWYFTQDKYDEVMRETASAEEVAHRNFPPLVVGDNVTVSVPRLDRASTDPRNLLGVVIEVLVDINLYRVGNRDGVLERAVARNQLAKLKEHFLAVEDVPRDKSLALRTMAAATSHSGGQGYTRCMCKKGCSNKNCGCVSKGEKCKSQCHGGAPCTNK